MRNINTKKLKRVNEKTLLVTVDMGKTKHTGYYRCPDGTEAKPFDFFNNREGFQEFWNRICQARRHHKLQEVVVGFESTGSYAEPLLHFLRKKQVRVIQVNPMHTKRVKELQGNSPNKTDHKDPKVIADIIELGHALTVVIPEGAAAELRRLTQARERSIQRRTAFLNQVHGLVFLIFPEFLEVMKKVKGKSAQYLLKHYPTPESIVQYGCDALSTTLKTVSRGRYGRDRAEELYEAARASVGIKDGQGSIVLEIRECLSFIEASNRFITEVEDKISHYLEQIPYSRSILSIKGIGEVSAAGLIGEVGDFRQFNTTAEVLKLAGLDLFEISSGKHQGKRRISKRGRPLLRKLLFFISINAVKKGGIMHNHYKMHLDKGMPRKKALIAISRKLIGIIFALVRNHSTFTENYSEQHRLRKAA